MHQEPRFGDIYYAALKADGNVQGGKRPVIIAQNNIGNLHSPTVEIIPLSSNTLKGAHLPIHVTIKADQQNGLKRNSVALTEQVRVINKNCLENRVGQLAYHDLVGIGRARSIQSPFPAS